MDRGGIRLIAGVRLATSVVLTRLLAPELFGIMVIFNSLKAGIELLTDVGIGQSIIYNRNAEDPDFYNTAWTLAAIRGVILWVLACAVTVPVATTIELQFYFTSYRSHPLSWCSPALALLNGASYRDACKFQN